MHGLHQAFLFFALVALALAGYELWRIHLGIEAQRWKRTTGTLTDAWVDDATLAFEQGDDGDTRHSANVRYHFKVGPRWYKSSRLSYRGTLWLPEQEAHDLLDGLVAGNEIEVHYDPRNPARSVLVPGSSTGNLLNLVLYLFAAGFAVFLGVR